MVLCAPQAAHPHQNYLAVLRLADQTTLVLLANSFQIPSKFLSNCF
jgi:hypothetical protein